MNSSFFHVNSSPKTNFGNRSIKQRSGIGSPGLNIESTNCQVLWRYLIHFHSRQILTEVNLRGLHMNPSSQYSRFEVFKHASAPPNICMLYGTAVDQFDSKTAVAIMIATIGPLVTGLDPHSQVHCTNTTMAQPVQSIRSWNSLRDQSHKKRTAENRTRPLLSSRQ